MGMFKVNFQRKVLPFSTVTFPRFEVMPEKLNTHI